MRHYNSMLIGALAGDIVGSRFEFNNCRNKNFRLFDYNCDFTDDTVMTLAVAKSLIEPYYSLEDYKKRLVDIMHRIGKNYPNSGYGGRFFHWIMKDKTEPYYSLGNGSAMRVSPVGWVAGSLNEAENLAKATAEITHNHPEGIKGAQVVAGMIYLARNGAKKQELREYASEFYDLDFSLDEIRKTYSFDETCQGSVPQAIVAFLEADSFEDALRNAVSIGGDSDTIACIAGSIAEAYYIIDDKMKKKVLHYLDEKLLTIYNEFNQRFI